MSGGTIPHPVPTSPDVLVIGGGMAGLCAAVELSSRGWRVLLTEQKQHLGGRVYSFIDESTGDEVDNGQHLLLGCYHSTFRYLDTVGTRSLAGLQDTLAIPFRSVGHAYRLQAPRLPSPLHVAGALASLPTLSVKERLALLRTIPSLLSTSVRRRRHLESITVAQWLRETGQSDAAQRRLWNILAVGMLNEQPDESSAEVFLHVLRTIFLGAPRDAAFAVPRCGLSRLFGDAGSAYLAAHNGTVQLATRADAIIIRDGRAITVRTGNEVIAPMAVIAAVPHHAVSRLFDAEASQLLPMLARTDQFVDVPIVSIHLWFEETFMEEAYAALLESPIEWVFKKSWNASEGSLEAGARRRPMQLSLVVSAARDFAARPKNEIIRIAVQELWKYFPKAGGLQPVHALVVKERRATFSPSLSIAESRPSHRTPVENLFLAGDWTDTTLPSTIEGAAQSGYACADAADEFLRGISERKK